MAETPIIAQKAPFKTDVESGKTYFWCSCGQSPKQPFCDGSHKETSFSPVKFVPEEDGKVFFCACKHTSNGVKCDGSHNKL